MLSLLRQKPMNEDLVIRKIITLEADMKEVKERLIRLDDIEEYLGVVMSNQDHIIRVLTKLEQEMTFANERFARHEKRLDNLEQAVF